VVGSTQNQALPPIMWTKASFTLASGNLSIMAQTPERSAKGSVSSVSVGTPEA